MKNSIWFIACIIVFSSCHPHLVTLKQHHAKRIHGTKQVIVVPESSDMLRFNRKLIHISSEKEGVTYLMANPGASGKGTIERPKGGAFKKYKYKIIKNPSHK